MIEISYTIKQLIIYNILKIMSKNQENKKGYI